MPFLCKPIAVALVAVSLAAPAGASGLAGADLTKDTTQFLTVMGEIEGEFATAVRLYREGHADTALTHLEYRDHDLYAGYSMALLYRGVSSAEQEYRALAEAIREDRGIAAVEANWERLEHAGRIMRKQAAATPAERFGAAAGLLRDAGEDYGAAVENGRVIDAAEFRNAWGVAQVAVGELDRMAADGDPAVRARAADALRYTEALPAFWPDIAGAEAGGDGSELYGMAAWVEIAALR